MSVRQAIQLLEQCCVNGLPWMELNGYYWLQASFLPAISTLQSSPTSEEYAGHLAVGYHLLGDLYFVHDAPKACARAYRLALHFAPRDGDLLRELADVLAMLGRHDESRRYERRAHELAAASSGGGPSSQDSVFQASTPIDAMYRTGDLLWSVSEQLASRQPMLALRMLEGRRGVLARRLRAMAWGAVANSAAAMNEWSHIAKMSGTIELSGADWFVLPADLWENTVFWESILTIVPRVSNLGLHSPTSEIQGPPELLVVGATKESWNKIHSTAVEYHLARTSADADRLNSLSKSFPRWRDCHETLLFYEHNGKMPTQKDLLRILARRAG